MLDQWQNKQVAVVGLGVSNEAASRYLLAKGARLVGRDQKDWEDLPPGIRALKDKGMEFQLGSRYLDHLDGYDGILLSPGIPKSLPAIARLRESGLVFSEIDLVFAMAQCPISAITGSSGKTTTTRLVGDMLEKSGVPTYVGGNIGTPLIEQVETIADDARLVLELSSFQLEWLCGRPQVALVTNISENHLDNHGTMANYIAAKKGIFRWQTADDILVLNYDDPVTADFAKDTMSQVHYFSRRQKVGRGAYLDGNTIVYNDGCEVIPICSVQQIPLKGAHNVENVLAAVALAGASGASVSGMAEAIVSFSGVEHRLEPVGIVDQVAYFNDSIATSPARSIAGVHSFAEPVILLAGGSDKKLSYDTWAASLAGRLRGLVLLGASAPLLEASIHKVYGSERPFKMISTTNLERATAIAHQWSHAGDVVLLSPACASFDQYRGYQERGEHFRQLVQKMLEDRSNTR